MTGKIAKINGGQKGRLTIKTAALFFFISSAFDVLSIKSEILLFGEIRSGSVAMVYHLIYAIFFLAIGFSLWTEKPWALKTVLCGSIFYTLDKFQLLINRAMLESHLMHQMSGYGITLASINRQSLHFLIILTIWMLIAGWWGFLVYLYFRRDNFRIPRSQFRHADGQRYR